MYYVQKYLDNYTSKASPVPKINNNVILYCNFYSFYSQKVIMALYEKHIDFDTYVIDITKGEQYSSWFLDMNPRGEIPVLKIDSHVIPDSTRILDYLEDHFNPELKPLVRISPEPKVINDVNKFRELLEALPAGVITVGSFFHPHLCGRPKLPFIQPVREMLKSGDLGSAQNLRRLADVYPSAKSVLLYKAEIQDRKHEILTSEEEYLKVLNIVDHVLYQVEQQLKTQTDGNWLCCDIFSIADINLAVLLQRLWELGLEDRFWAHGKKPYLESYFNKISQRESFKRTIPNIPYHLKMIVTSQPPVYVAAAAVASVGVVVTFLLVLKKIIK